METRCTVGGIPPPERRPTSLLIDENGNWLCPACKDNSDDPPYGFVRIQRPENQSSDNFLTDPLPTNWDSDFYLSWKFSVPVNCFANPLEAFQCCNVHCSFNRTRYHGAPETEGLWEETAESVAELRKMQANWPSRDNAHPRNACWSCPACSVWEMDFRFHGIVKEEWGDHVRSANFMDLVLSKQRRVYQNPRINGRKCGNMLYGLGPDKRDEPCCYRYGLSFEFVQTKSGYNVGRVVIPKFQEYSLPKGFETQDLFFYDILVLRITGLPLDIRGFWLCSDCSICPKDEIWPEAQQRGYVKIMSKRAWVVVDQLRKNFHYSHFEEMYIQLKGVCENDPQTWVALFANPPDTFHCLNKRHACAFSRRPFRGTKYPLLHADTEEAEQQLGDDAFKQLRAIIGQTGVTFNAGVPGATAWVCPMCSADPEDLKKDIADVRNWANYIYSGAPNRFISVKKRWGSKMSEEIKERYCFVNQMAMTTYGRRSYVCQNQGFGKGPKHENVPCDFTYGAGVEFIPDSSQYGCWIAVAGGGYIE
ncbi:hypothetical protein BU26DRAFT_504212 [Trematosphaeria pertusa]|uniref:Uncharacterized protein n=1 Tax=Trematosphaeria pertusa TaxID=390896 RepID=A0A6A6IJQ3_9PLEO|nr:uncharacterized protein BU26DRAFT_504212 [Trematosphaeria pertusa]KAF2249773.1 hypothetical protein BU26DRAFT_504212 [Trematosphaeria pertusa]